jgi:integrase
MKAGLDEHAAEAGLDATVENWLERMARKFGTGHDGAPLLPETKERAVRLAHRVFSGDQPDLLADYIKKHLKELAPRITASALATKQRHLRDFSTWAGADAELATITRRVTARYVMEVIEPGTQATKTKTDHIANLSAFGSWLERYGFCESNPWRGLARTIKESTRREASRRMRPYTVDEVQQLLTKLPAGPMRDVTVLALWTGMRLEELCQLKTEHVKDGCLQVVAGKSANAVRAVPIASTIGPLVEHLKSASTDTYLISGCRPTGADKKRSATMSARFSAWLRANGWKGDHTVTFRSTRRTVATRLEAAGVPHHIAAKVLGHARGGMSYGLYSGGPERAQLVAAVAAIEYGPEVAALV